MTTRRKAQRNPPSLATAGFFGAQHGLAPFLDAIPSRLVSWTVARCALADDFSRDLAKAGQTDRTGRAGGEVEHPATHERAAVVDGHDDGTAAMGNPQLGAERQ